MSNFERFEVVVYFVLLALSAAIMVSNCRADGVCTVLCGDGMVLECDYSIGAAVSPARTRALCATGKEWKP